MVPLCAGDDTCSLFPSCLSICTWLSVEFLSLLCRLCSSPGNCKGGSVVLIGWMLDPSVHKLAEDKRSKHHLIRHLLTLQSSEILLRKSNSMNFTMSS